MNSIFFISSKAISLLVVFICTALIAREVGPAEFGVFTELKVYISIVFIISLFGNDAYIISLINDNNDRKKVTTIILTRLILFILLSIPIYCFYESKYFIAIFLMYFFQLLNLSFLTLNASKGGRFFFLLNFIALCSTLLFGLFSKIYSFDLYLYFIPFFYFILFVTPYRLILAAISDVSFSFFIQSLKSVFFDVWPLILSSFLVFFYTRIDFLLISHFLTPSELGIYSVAVQLSEPFSFVISAYATSIISDLSSVKNDRFKKSKFISQKLKFIHLFVLFLLSFYFLFGRFLIEMFFSSQYEGSFNLLLVLVFSKFFVFSNLFFSIVMVVENNYFARLKRIFISMVFAVLISLLLIPTYGLYGAAVGVVISQFVAVTIVNALSKDTRDYYNIFVRSILFWK